DAATLAGRHLLDPAWIAPVALDAEAGRTAPDPVAIAGLIRARAAASLPPGIEVVTPAVPWSRLVLAEGADFQLRDAVALRLLAAHAVVRDAVPVLVARPLPEGAGSAELAVPELPGPLLVIVPAGSALRFPADRPVLAVPAGELSALDRRLAWLAALPELSEPDAATLAGRHLLDPAWIAPVALDAEAGRTAPDPVAIAGLIRARAAASLPPGIEVVTPAVPWSRLVLAEGADFQLRDAVARLEHQALVLDDWQLRQHARASRGVRMLLTGLPGTGKSLAAEAVASAAGTDLLRVDVSQIVSKWIGETEKNLASAFDVAERTQSVLFLDEADSLFGTRTEISDAHDRYANLETAYLLQRLDHFDGLAVLATNLRHNIDPAFVRRMDFVVDFPLPDEPRRRELWRLHLPPGRVAADVDLAVLARLYPIPGGWIRNAAVAAAFFAAAAGDLIAQDHLIAAVRREYLKAALPCPGDPVRRRDDS
ncbi:MAG TPA: AAA family ATPase, partial [Jatrophihabitans sp.]|nr:AAA family ATPase [Jatrophihabitans sp.]